jgi:hypothetical protein
MLPLSAQAIIYVVVVIDRAVFGADEVVIVCWGENVIHSVI